MKRNLCYFLMTFFVLAGSTSCSDNDVNNLGVEPVLEGNTHVNIALKIPSAMTRAADDPNYNTTGTYSGFTGIHHLDVYLMSSDGQMLLDSKCFSNSEFLYGSSPNGEDMITLNSPFKTTAGDKMMLVVINSPNVLYTNVPADDLVLSSSNSNSLNRNTISTPLPFPTSPSTAPLSLGYMDMDSPLTIADGTVYPDELMLTGKSGIFSIQDGVSKEDVINTKINMVDINVIRIPSRAIITSAAPEQVVNSEGVTLGTISNLTYSVVQGANSIYLLPQLDANGNAKSWGYDYIPNPAVENDYAANAPMYYDYSDINTLDRAIPAQPANGNIAILPGVFLFESTHPYGMDASSTGYRKGNTPYILVRAKFTPDPAQVAGGGTLPADGTFYMGSADGKIYTSIEEAQKYENGAQDQPVYTYTAGKVLYHVWLNPDNIQKPVNSPVIRNNIYHVKINSFKNIGLNWNPLVPPGSTTPHNPDAQPSTGQEPESPANPAQPLSDINTYMAVEVTALNWTVHSYGIDL